MPDLDGQLQRWIDAHIVDAATAERIRQFEADAGQTRRRWPAVLAVSFGALMLCAGVLLFVAAHWDELSPTLRFTLVLAMVAVFHLAAGILGRKVEIVGVALHFAGTAALGAAIFLSAQIFNLEEHWPSGLLLWAIGAVAGWFVLRQWPQALAAAILVPWWLAGEWDLAAHDRPGSGSIVAEGLLLLAILYLTVVPRERNRALRLGLVWLGSISLLPCILFVVVSGEHLRWRWHDQTAIPIYLMVLGYAGAYLPVLAFAAITRKMASLRVFAAAAWVLVLSALSQTENTDSNPWLYLWLALGATGLCFWGVRENRKLFINFGIVIFALTVVTFYFSSVLDKLGRSMGLILLGVIFLAGGWVLHRLRTDLIARAAAGGRQ